MQTALGAILSRLSRRYPEKTAIIFKEKRLTYRDLNIRSNKLSHALIELGVKSGEKVGLIFNNCNEFVESIFAILKAGAIAVPINVRLNPQEISFLLDHSDVSLLIFQGSFMEKIAPFWGKNRKIRHYIICDEEYYPGFLHYETLLQKGALSDPEIRCAKEDDDAFILYTAGTTGRPKGVILTHRNFLWLAFNYCLWGMTEHEDISLYVFPLYHVGGLGTFLSHIFIGATAVLKDRYDLSDCLKTIQREGINRWSAIPTIYSEVVNFPELDRYNLSSLSKISSGGAPMSSDLKHRIMDLFPYANIMEGYGQTESSGAITMLLPEDTIRKSASVGIPFPTNVIKIVDEDDNELPIGYTGELLYQGYTVMKGYYKNREATEYALKGGWMHSGDLATIDEDGFVYIVDRKDDVIITGGENVYSKEVEDTIKHLDGVKEVAVIGLPDPKWGKAVTAIVVPESEVYLTEEQIINFCKGKIAGYKAPKRVIFTKELPKNSVGKVIKSELREIYSKEASIKT